MTGTKRITAQVAPWKKGEPITARRLDRMGRNINDNSFGLSGPKQLGAKAESDQASIADFEFTEISRQEITENLTDSNGDTSPVLVMTKVTMQNEAGQTLILNFDPP